MLQICHGTHVKSFRHISVPIDVDHLLRLFFLFCFNFRGLLSDRLLVILLGVATLLGLHLFLDKLFHVIFIAKVLLEVLDRCFGHQVESRVVLPVD